MWFYQLYFLSTEGSMTEMGDREDMQHLNSMFNQTLET